MVINVLCESSLIELNNPFSNMTLDEAFNMFTENVNIILNEEKANDSGSYIRDAGEYEFRDKGPNVNKSKIKNIIDSIIDNISKLWDKFIEFIQNFTSMVMKKFLSIGIDKKKSWNLINNMKEDFTVTIKGTVVTDDQYKAMIKEDFYAQWYKDFVEDGKEIEKYFANYRRVDYEYKITRQVGINAWNTIFNSKSKFVSEAIKSKKSYTKGLSILADKNSGDDYIVGKTNKKLMQGLSKICKEEISVYRDYLKTCAKVLKAIINHGGDSKFHYPEIDDDSNEYYEEA